MNILLTCNNAFLKPTLVTLNNIVKKVKSQLHFYLLTFEQDKIDDNQIIKIKKLLKKNDAFYNVVVPNNYQIDFSSLPLNGWNKTLYLRLFAPYFLKEIDYCISIDSDIIILDGKVIIQYYSSFVGDEYNSVAYYGCNHLPYRVKSLGINDNIYLNNGFLFMNFKRIRSMYPEPISLYNAILETDCDFAFPDQDALNLLFDGSKKAFHNKDFQNIAGNYLLDENNTIIHYCGYGKPWITYGYKRPLSKIWYRYSKPVYGSLFFIKNMVLSTLYKLYISLKKKRS